MLVGFSLPFILFYIGGKKHGEKENITKNSKTKSGVTI